MIQFNKKQMTPLIEKYQINVETNRLFTHILEMFKDQENYQVWGVKVVFSRAITIHELETINQWINTYKSKIKTLSKGNIVAYNTKPELHTLLKEMQGVEMINAVNAFISKFNTEQRQLLKNYYEPGTITPLSAYQNARFRKFYEKACKAVTLPAWRQRKLYSNASRIHDSVDDILKCIDEAMSESYLWDKEDCISFITNNHPQCRIVFNNGPYLIVLVDSYESSKSICGHSRTKWCITEQEHMWQSYTSPRNGHDRAQYFFFDFSKKEEDQLAHIGFTVENNVGIVEAQTTDNKALRDGCGFNYHGKPITIDDVFNRCGVKNSELFEMKFERGFKWDRENILKLDKRNGFNLITAKDDKIILQITTPSGCEQLLGPISQKLSDRFYEDGELFAIIDLSYAENDDNSIVTLFYSKDQWGSKSLTTFRNLYGRNLLQTPYLREHNIVPEDFVQFPKIDKNVTFHKLIAENNEEAALKLMQDNPDLDLNYVFDEEAPIFRAIEMEEWDLVESMYDDPRCNVGLQHPISGSILSTLLYLYLAEEFDEASQSEKKGKEKITQLITRILEAPSTDCNTKNSVDDSPLSIMAEFPELSWAMAKLLARPEVNVNAINHFGMTAFDIALTEDNTAAIGLLANRSDMVVSELGKRTAAERHIDLHRFGITQPMTIAEAWDKVYAYSHI